MRHPAHALASAALATLVALAATPALAGDDPQAICRLLIPGPTTNTEGLCSGSLVQPDILLTAAHCLEHAGSGTIQVSCGYVGKAGNGKESFIEEFKGVATRSAAFDGTAENDIALIRLDHPSRVITPIALPPTLAEFQARFMRPNAISGNDMELNPSVECHSAGFGVAWGDPRGLSTFRISDQSPANGLKLLQGAGSEYAGAMQVQGWGDGIGQLRKGDSGGPFYCRTDKSSAWTQVGVHSKVMVKGKDPLKAVPLGVSQLSSVTSDAFYGLLRSARASWGAGAPTYASPATGQTRYPASR